MQITGSILQPNISGNIKISQGEAYLPHERGGTPASNRFPSNQSVLPTAGVSRMFASRYVSRFLNSEFASLREKVSQSFGSGITLHACEIYDLICSNYSSLVWDYSPYYLLFSFLIL